jgi:hypothetical protein
VADFDADDALRARLAALDPAHDLPPADPDALARMLAEIVATPTGPLRDARPARRRTATTWLVAAAAAVVIAGAGGYALTRGGDEAAAPSAGQGTDQRSDGGLTELTPPTPGDAGLPVPGTTSLSAQPALAAAGRCAVLTPDLLSGSDQAFAGTVTAMDAGTVTIRTTEVFAGEVGQTVEVTAPPADLQQLVGAASFETGGSYLVAATDGLVSPCGLTGKATADLQAVYDQAFVR